MFRNRAVFSRKKSRYIFATTWLVDFQQPGLVTETSVLLALIAGTLFPLAIYGYSRKRGVTVKKCVIGAVSACVLAGAFIAVLIVLDKNMMNGLDSHLAYFTVCLVLEGVALLGLLLLLPCAFLRKGGTAHELAEGPAVALTCMNKETGPTLLNKSSKNGQ